VTAERYEFRARIVQALRRDHDDHHVGVFRRCHTSRAAWSGIGLVLLVPAGTQTIDNRICGEVMTAVLETTTTVNVNGAELAGALPKKGDTMNAKRRYVSARWSGRTNDDAPSG
jgi:hypothetical protein